MSRVLLVEDSKVQALVATRLLTDAGYTVEHVSTAEDALKTCYDSPPDILLQDQHLAEMSGLEVCRRVKSDIALSSIPVLVLTAGNKDRDHVSALDAGADAFLPKDSPRQELLAVISRLIETARSMKPADADEHAKYLSKRTRILGIDHGSTFSQALIKRLGEAGFEVSRASSTQEGLSLLRKEPFDVAVVDVDTGEKDGFEFCAKARQWATEQNFQLGLLVMTGSDHEDVLFKAFEAGADDVTKSQEMNVIMAHTSALARRVSRAKQIKALNKRALTQDAIPSVQSDQLARNTQELFSSIDEINTATDRLVKTELTDGQNEQVSRIRQSADSLLRLIGDLLDVPNSKTEQSDVTTDELQADKTASEAQSSKAISDVSKDAAQAATEQTESDSKHVDGELFNLEVAATRIPGGVEAAKEMVPMLISECAKQLDAVREGLAEQKAEQVRRGAHTIKGSADVFAAKRVVHVARQLEEMGRNGDLSGAAPVFEELASEVAALRKAIEAACK